ncbi:MAG: hypothetical protein JNK11_05235 [Alphaproteobacteria bacterium]|nr:hypothetical protein [Alphaproteobacteria bacterium]
MQIRTDWTDRTIEVLRAAEAFAPVYAGRPFDNVNGLIGTGALALYYFIKQVAPPAVIEVGVWRGFSTWVIEQAAPGARIRCHDPLFGFLSLLDPAKSQPAYRSPHATYSQREFSCLTDAELGDGRRDAVVFFDDHQDMTARIIQASRMGFRHLVFDDDWPGPCDHATLAHHLAAGSLSPDVAAAVRRYERFPLLWEPLTWNGATHAALPLPVTPALEQLHAERQFYSWVSYVELA